MVTEEILKFIKQIASNNFRQVINYIKLCEKSKDYKSFIVGCDREDLANNKLTVVIKYKTYNVIRKFDK